MHLARQYITPPSQGYASKIHKTGVTFTYPTCCSQLNLQTKLTPVQRCQRHMSQLHALYIAQKVQPTIVYYYHTYKFNFFVIQTLRTQDAYLFLPTYLPPTPMFFHFPSCLLTNSSSIVLCVLFLFLFFPQMNVFFSNRFIHSFILKMSFTLTWRKYTYFLPSNGTRRYGRLWRAFHIGYCKIKN